MSDDFRGAMEAAMNAAADESPTSASDSTPDSTPVESVSPPDSPAVPADTAPQPSDTGVVPTEKPRGPIPYDRHEAVLNNVRKEYEWVKEHGDPQTVQQKLAILRRAEQDPASFVRDFVNAARLNPQELFTPPAPPAPVAPPEPPQPDILLENGQLSYSHERLQQLLAWKEAQIEQRISQTIAPIQQRVALADMQEQATVRARQELSAAQAWPGFAEAKADMAAFLRANPTATLRDAYIAVVPARLAEQAKASETQGYQKALTELQQKAGAASAPAPRTAGQAPGATAGLSFRELLEEAARG